jgi:putative PIN family toxin of toxin-antitoxin system
VLVSAAISRGLPRELVLLWHEGAFELVVSYDLLYELEVVLLREKFRRYLSEGEALEYILWLRESATLAHEGDVVRPVSPDPDDDYLIALARSSSVDYLVSGDPHLTRLEDPRPPVLTPRAFLELMERP